MLSSRRRRRRSAPLRLGSEPLERRAMLSAATDASPVMMPCRQGIAAAAASSATARAAAPAAAAGAPTVTVAPSGDNRIDALLGQTPSKWDASNITFSFYAGGTYYGTETSPTPVSNAVKANVRYILSSVIAPLVNLTFTEVVADSPTSFGTLRYLCSPDAGGSAYARLPGTGAGDSDGDVVLDPALDVVGSPASFQRGPGSYGFDALIHETCHALGLKHPGNYNAGGGGSPLPYLPAEEDNWDNTLMSYNQSSGKEPGTPMAYDLLALQYLYQANTSTRSGDTTYVFSKVDDFTPGGVVSSGPPAPRFGDLKQSLWDGGGTDTVDCSSLPSEAQGYRIDVSPGGWITKNTAYDATWYKVTSSDPWFLPGTSGNTYAATTSGTRIPLAGTIIENVVVSRSSDTIQLNAAANRVSGFIPGIPGGRDVVSGADQADTLDLSRFRRSAVTETRTGDDLVITLGFAGSVTVKDHFAAAEGSRMTILYDTTPGVSIADATVVEGDSGTSYVDVVVTLSAVAPQDVSVAYATANGSARTTGADYVATSGTLTFLPGETQKTIRVAINGDTRIEADETFTVQLSNVVNAAVDRLAAIVTIRNDDVPPSVSVDDIRVMEGTGGTTTATFTIQLNAPRATGVSVRYVTLERTATPRDGDYRTATGTVSIPAGQTSVTVPVTVTADSRFEADETFAFRIVSATDVQISRPIATCTIVNDDAAPIPALSVGDVRLAEGDAAQKMFSFLVSLSEPSATTVTVGFRTVDGTAVAGRDYVGTTGSLVFSPGMTKRSITVWVTGDTELETNEQFSIQLEAPSAATLGRATATGTILNDDRQPAARPSTAAVFAALASADAVSRPAARRR